MEIQEFEQRMIKPFGVTRENYIFNSSEGYVVWRLGAGHNVELLHIEVFTKRVGFGRKLFYSMLDQLKKLSEFYSVFGFSQSTNLDATEFYLTLGFYIRPVACIYEEPTAVLFSQSYEKLLEVRKEYEDNLRS